jgi:hypothetical protein
MAALMAMMAADGVLSLNGRPMHERQESIACESITRRSVTKNSQNEPALRLELVISH